MTAEYMALRGRDGFVDGGRLQPIESATTVRIEDGEALVTDGPFAATKEVFAGYFRGIDRLRREWNPGLAWRREAPRDTSGAWTRRVTPARRRA